MKIFAVGGSVRDELLGRSVKDEDFVVVGATEQQMIDAGFNKVGADFPVFLDDDGREHALARQERKTGPGYHGFETRFDPSVTLEDDLIRRDLTINAIAKDPDTGEIIDPHGGLDDLRAGILRHVSDAFAEDPVRVLRVARFAARFNFTVAPETMELMKKLVDDGELQFLTPERVWTELEKALMEDEPNVFFWTLDKCGAKDVLFPELGRSLIIRGWPLGRAALRNADRLTRMMLLFSRADSERVKDMLLRLKAPSDVQRLTRKFHFVMDVVENGDLTSEQLVNLFKNIDAFRRPEDVFAVSSAIGFFGDALSNKMDIILRALKEASKIVFSTLSDNERNTLKGKEIGRAIDRERLKKISQIT